MSAILTTTGTHRLAPDPLVRKSIMKPYMYVERELAPTMRQRLDNRSTLLELEYMTALVALIKDDRREDQENNDLMLDHLHDIMSDRLAGRAWERVRAYSQRVFDMIERDQFTWDDKQSIHNVKSLLLTENVGHRDTRTSSANPPGRQQAKGPVSVSHGRVATCRDFNSAKGCSFESDHGLGDHKVYYICSHCNNLSGKWYS